MINVFKQFGLELLPMLSDAKSRRVQIVVHDPTVGLVFTWDMGTPEKPDKRAFAFTPADVPIGAVLK